MNTGQHVPDASGTIALPPAPAHPTLERALANPIIRTIVSALFGIALAYVSVQTTSITNKLEQYDGRLGELEQYKAAHEATHAAVDKYRAEQSARWEKELGAKAEQDQRILATYEKSAALDEQILQALLRIAEKQAP